MRGRSNTILGEYILESVSTAKIKVHTVYSPLSACCCCGITALIRLCQRRARPVAPHLIKGSGDLVEVSAQLVHADPASVLLTRFIAMNLI